MEKNLCGVMGALGIIVPRVAEEMEVRVCGSKKSQVVRDENGRYRLNGKFIKPTKEAKVAVIKASLNSFRRQIEAAKSEIDADLEQAYTNIDDIESVDAHRRQNELGLDDKIINDENRISLLDSWIVSYQKKINSLLEKIEKELEKDYPAIMMMLCDVKVKAEMAFDKAKEEYRRTREWQIKNAWQLTSKPHANDVRWVENSLEILAGEGSWCRRQMVRAQSRYESFVEDMDFCAAFGIDDVAAMKAEIRDLKAKIAKHTDSINYLAKAIDAMLNNEDDSPLKAWELATVQKTMEEWTDEELVTFIDLSEGGKGKLIAQDILHERLVATWYKVSFKSRLATFEAIDDNASTLEQKIAAGKLQSHAKKLSWDVKKSWAEQVERCSVRKAISHKYAMERIVKAGDDELDPVVDYIKVEEFYFENANGEYLPISHTVVRPICQSEVAFIEDIKRGSTNSLFSFQGSLPKVNEEKIGLRLAMTDDLFIQNAD
jgi:hypothetical protein